MLQTVQLALNRYMAVMPKLTVAFRKTDVDATAPKKNDKADGTENSKVDTVEISSTRKKPDTSVLRPDLEELVNYVREQAERRKPPKVEVTYTEEDIEKMKASKKAQAEELERRGREKAIAERLCKIDAKMKSGRVPNGEEMNFLSKHDHEAYMNAKRMAAEKEQFRNQLRNCKTKEERTQLVLIKKKMLEREAEIIIRASKHTKAPVGVLCVVAMIDREAGEYESDSHVKKADREEDERRKDNAGNAKRGMAAIDREVEENDKRNGTVKKSDREGVKERNGKTSNTEIGSAEAVEMTDASIKKFLDPTNKVSGDDKKGASKKGYEQAERNNLEQFNFVNQYAVLK